MFNPGASFLRISADDRSRPIEIEASTSGLLDPSALRDEPVFYNLWLARRPRHLLDRLVLVQPTTGFNGYALSVLVAQRTPVWFHEWMTPQSRIDTARWPEFATWSENVSVHWHVRMK